MASFTWSTWSLSVSSWVTSYKGTGSATISRAYGSDTATVSFTMSMQSVGGDTASWTYHFKAGSTTKTVTVSGTHTAGTSYSKTATISVSAAAAGGSVDVSMWMTINGYESYSGGTSSTKTASLTYGSKGYSTITSASSVTLGNSCSITFTPYSTSFYYKIKFSMGSVSLTATVGKPGVTTAYEYTGQTLTAAKWGPAIPSATSGTMTATLYTYSDSSYSTSLGSSSKTFTVTMPSYSLSWSSSPSLTLSSSNSTVSSWGIAVAGYTALKVAATATSLYGATIKSYTLSGAYSTTVSGTTLSYTGSVISSSGSKSVTVKATDTRGKTLSASVSVTYYAYSKPSVSTFVVTRGLDAATTIYYKLAYSYSSCNSKNAASATISYKLSSASSWTSLGTKAAASSSTELTTGLSASSTYDFKVTVTDSLGNTSTATRTLSTASVLVDFRDGGTGIGFGKYAETDDQIETSLKLVSSVTGMDGIKVEHGTSSASAGIQASRTDGSAVSLAVGAGGTNHGVYSNTRSQWLLYSDASKTYVDLAGTLATKTFDTGELSVSASTNYSGQTLDVSYDGYTAIGIVGVRVTGSSYLNLWRYTLSDATVTYGYRNMASSDTTATYYFTVLYIKDML